MMLERMSQHNIKHAPAYGRHLGAQKRKKQAARYLRCRPLQRYNTIFIMLSAQQQRGGSSTPAQNHQAQHIDTSSETLLRTIHRLLERIEAWLDTTHPRPGDNGVSRITPRTIRRTPTYARIASTGADPPGSRPASRDRTLGLQPSDYERSVLELRRAFGLTVSRADLAPTPRGWKGGPPVAGGRPSFLALPPVDEDVRSISVYSASNIRKDSCPAAVEQASAAAHTSRALVPVEVSTGAVAPRFVSARIDELRPQRGVEAPAEAPAAAASIKSPTSKANYADMALLVVENWRQSIMLRVKNTRHHLRGRTSSKPTTHPLARRQTSPPGKPTSRSIRGKSLQTESARVATGNIHI